MATISTKTQTPVGRALPRAKALALDTPGQSKGTVSRPRKSSALVPMMAKPGDFLMRLEDAEARDTARQLLSARSLASEEPTSARPPTMRMRGTPRPSPLPSTPRAPRAVRGMLLIPAARGEGGAAPRRVSVTPFAGFEA